MTNLNPEFIQTTLSTIEEDEYNEDLRPRLDTATVFDAARMSQMEFLKISVKKEQFLDIWNAAQKTIYGLDQQARQDGVMGEHVTLVGDTIKVPKFDIDFEASIAMISLRQRSETDDNLHEHFLSPHAHQGAFNGFTIRFEKNDTTDNTYTPVLAYQVSAGEHYGPNAHITLVATGDVGPSHLIFDKDERRDAIKDSLLYLLETYPHQAEVINRINVALSVPKIDASSLRHVGYHVEKCVSNLPEDEQKVFEDLISDFIMHYIGRRDINATVTKEYSMFSSDGEENESTRLFYERAESVTFTNMWQDVVFFDRHIIRNGELDYSHRRVPHASLYLQDRLVYIPLYKIEEFTNR